MPPPSAQLFATAEETFKLMRGLFSGIGADEATATEVARIAEEADRQGKHREAEALRTSDHRIRASESLALIALLDAVFGALQEGR